MAASQYSHAGIFIEKSVEDALRVLNPDKFPIMKLQYQASPLKNVTYQFPRVDFSSEKPVDWVPPNYENQQHTIGYSENNFKVPDSIRSRVDFWKDIYTKYSSWQGLVHDSLYINKIYFSVDFSDIMLDDTLNAWQKKRARKKRVKAKKKEVKKILMHLQTIKDPSALQGDELRIWNMYTEISGHRKFFDASRRRRLRFQLGQRNFFHKGIYDSGRYLKTMEKIFSEYKIPKQITRLVFVESSFNLKARSKVGASGIWQFMRSTARLYMKVGHRIDYRNDPIQSTIAAAKLLRNNYRRLKSWPLAITAYNYGPSGMVKLVRRLNTDNLFEIIKEFRGRRFGFASSNFYASFLAALEVEEDAQKYFTNLKTRPALEFDTLKLSRSISYFQLKELFQGDNEMLVKFNPQLSKGIRRNYFTIARKSTLYLPKGKLEEFLEIIGTFKYPTINKKLLAYQIIKGDTLSGIGEAFGVSVRTIMDLNGLVRANRIRVGQILSIPILTSR